MTGAPGLDDLRPLVGNRLGRHDVPCPVCGPTRRAPRNKIREVLRIWVLSPDFMSFVCARCDLRGYARDPNGQQVDRAALERARSEAAEMRRVETIRRLGISRYLWNRRRDPRRTVVETYLREPRGIACVIPATIGFLPPRGRHGPAMISAFGMAIEAEPGVLAMPDDAVVGVHVTRLLPDGSGKDDREGEAKITIGHCYGSPIVLAPPNDLLGLSIAEGIEDGLSVHQATGLGAWAAGTANRLPKLAPAIPWYIDGTTVVQDDDPDGRRYAEQLVEAIRQRRMRARLVRYASAAA
jgi:hypothetical protein